MTTRTLNDALFAAHYSYTDDNNTCDICAAYREGLYLYAARILTGATEAPEVEAALEAVGASEEDFEEQRKMMPPSVVCARCNARVYYSYELGACGNCGMEFGARKPENDLGGEPLCAPDLEYEGAGPRWDRLAGGDGGGYPQ